MGCGVLPHLAKCYTQVKLGALLSVNASEALGYELSHNATRVEQISASARQLSAISVGETHFGTARALLPVVE